MKETSPAPTYISRLRSLATNTKAHGGSRSSSRRPDPNLLPISNSPTQSSHQLQLQSQLQSSTSNSTHSLSHGALFSLRGGGGVVGSGDHHHHHHHHHHPNNNNSSSSRNNSTTDTAVAGISSSSAPGEDRHSPRPSPPQAEGPGSVIEAAAEGEADPNKKETKNNVFLRFYLTTKQILFHQWLNVLLVFVPVGIIVACVPGMPPAVIFSMNAVAIIPLAGLLSYATETVAHKMGDSVGALLNITFGNAVELIIFIALVKNEIRIVQASLLGSILANLLLILGMGFLLGGLRFREQIYNSTVTQMSACLLSLSVISLVLPTAFHASFTDSKLADSQSLKISRGTSVILLLVYGIYLLFQLKSHAYMYESMPQHLIDEESTPGPAAAWLDTSSSDDSSSSDSDSDTSGHSRDTMSKRMRRVIRAGRRRKNSVASQDTADLGPIRTPSFGTTNVSPSYDENASEEASTRPAAIKLAVGDATTATAAAATEEAIDDEKPHRHRKRRHRPTFRRHRKQKKKSSYMGSTDMVAGEETIDENPAENTIKGEEAGEPRRVDFALPDVTSTTTGEGGAAAAVLDGGMPRRPFNLRGMSFRPVAKSIAPIVFSSSSSQAPDARGALQPGGVGGAAVVPTGPIPRVRYGIRRTNSLPDRLNQHYLRAPGAMLPSQIPMEVLARVTSTAGRAGAEAELEVPMLSRHASVLLLVITTALVAVCADFMVDSINGLVATSNVGEIFIGLIVLPIVGNAAEHVTAVMVAMKNKMDLAIGVAVGSSIQIALFITPLVVILGWIIGRDMTLYFTLFETVCLFVSAFIVNFLVLDGRSNYLEGALLCATYVIIGVVAFYYPSAADANQWGQ